jgi:hypothetical protein
MLIFGRMIINKKTRSYFHTYLMSSGLEWVVISSSGHFAPGRKIPSGRSDEEEKICTHVSKRTLAIQLTNKLLHWIIRAPDCISKATAEIMTTINSVLSQVVCFIKQAQWDVEVQNLCVMCWTPASEVRCGYRPGYIYKCIRLFSLWPPRKSH